MNTISQAQFQKILDEVLQDITQQVAGISYVRRKKLPKTTKCILSTPHLKGAIKPASRFVQKLPCSQGSHNI